MINIKKFVFSPFSENTYVVWDSITLDAAIIDPGCYEINEEKKLAEFIKSNNLLVKYLINTHCHIDHIFGNAFIVNKYKPEFLAPEEDIPLLKQAVMQGEVFGVEVKPSPEPDTFITEKTKISLGDTDFRFLFTPGHTPGEYSIYCADESVCFTGDVLFNLGIGRTDLWGGDYNTLIDSIKNKLFSLPEKTVIYPGHGDKSTIGFEKLNNPFLK